MKKRIFSFVLLLCMVLTLLPDAAFAAKVVDSGTCGEHATWTLDSDGVLTIRGTGVISALEPGKVWSDYYPELQTVRIEEGITGIGENALATCPMMSITIPDSVTSIDKWAFVSCNRLQRVVLPDGITKIPDSAFAHCVSLTSVVLPDSVTSIGARAFAYCDVLTSISIPGGVTNIGKGAFVGCSSLWSFTFPAGITAIADYTFQFCKQLLAVTIPSSVTSIGIGAFADCPELTVFYTGSKEQLRAITVGTENEDLTNADVCIESVGPQITLGTLFDDMPAENNWAYPGIAFCVARGLMDGMGEGVFSPGSTLTRGQLVTILWRREHCPTAQHAAPFTDLKQDWYVDAVAWAAENNVVNGTSPTTFAPDVPITRQDMATILYRYQKDCVGDSLCQSQAEQGVIAAFPDGRQVSDYAKDAMNWAAYIGLIQGDNVNGVDLLVPRGNATRAQAATILMRLFGF